MDIDSREAYRSTEDPDLDFYELSPDPPPKLCECGNLASDLHYHCEERTETHGLDCGPYETDTQEWYSCPVCGAKYTMEEYEDLR